MGESCSSAGAESDVACSGANSANRALKRAKSGRFPTEPGERFTRSRLCRCMDGTPATILIIEDDRPTRMFLADNLSIDGFEIVESDCFSDAQRMIETKFPDLAIIDLGLPDRDGLDLLKLVRDNDRVAGRIDPDLPLLVLSGRADSRDRIRGLDRGADDYLVKP